MSEELYFYTMMGYPLPLRSEFFAYQTSTIHFNRPLQSFRSRLHPPSEVMQSVSHHLTKRQWIWKYIPGVKSVYLCDEISFNAYEEHMPIKFFVITSRRQLRLVKYIVQVFFNFVALITKLQGKKRLWEISAIVDEDHQDFSQYVLPKSDPYLVYWIAHLVPYYHYDFTLHDTYIEKNHWITYYLPNYMLRQTIFLFGETALGTTFIKKNMTRLFATWFFAGLNILLYSFTLFIKRFTKKSHSSLTRLETRSVFLTQLEKRKWIALQRELQHKIKLGEA